MEQHHQAPINNLDDFANAMAEVSDQSQKLVAEFLKHTKLEDGYSVLDPLVITKTFQEMAARIMQRPAAFFEEQLAAWNAYLVLWTRTLDRALLGTPASPLVEPAPEDKRFKDDVWVNDYVFDFVKQAYLLASRYAQSAVAKVEGLDETTKRKAEFYTRQLVDAMSPTNFAVTNPHVIEATLESGGENLLNGLKHLLQDLERGHGRLAVRMTDLNAFQLGENIATTPGKVVFQNELMQLLQYSPSTEQVHRRPLLIIPPWINKFYILDLKPKNSFIKWAVDQGHTVFVISWVNPDASLSHKSFDDYVLEGPLAALDQVGLATGEDSVNAIGYCIGGTLLASTLAYMAAKGDDRIKSATFLTSLMDFSDVGEVSVFIDEEQLTLLETHMNRLGYLEGHHMATAFNLLRENDLIWSFVVNNYLLGREPKAFDLLYWNSDSTRMPAAMQSFYLRNMYQRNLLKEPGGISLAGEKIDLAKITTPAYLLSTREDHIAPWKSTFAGTSLLAGPVKFVLGGSGHIAGVINPPVANKYGYWTSETKQREPEAWLETATAHQGSWWTDWAQWVSAYTDKLVSARVPGEGRIAAIEDAPGSYVRVRID